MGHSRPKYNSAVSTFCWAVANDEPFTVNDRSTELELLYIDDLVEGMFDLLENKEKHCEFDGVETVLKEDGRYCCVPVTHKVTLGEIVDLLQKFKQQPTTLMMPKIPDGSFAKKLYSLYLTYLPTDKFKYTLKMNADNRGSFTELVHTEDCGQVSINISRPGITKGQHWHNSKWELFIVVAGHGLIQERKGMPGVKLLVFGNVADNYKGEIEKSINENVIMLGWMNTKEINDVFLASDIAVFPGQHSVLWEQACACKIPCLFAYWDGMNHLNNGGNCAFICADSVEAIRNSIMKYANTDAYEALREKADSPLTDVFLYKNIADKEPVVLVILVGQLTVSRAKPMHIRMFQVTVPVLVLVQWSLRSLAYITASLKTILS